MGLIDSLKKMLSGGEEKKEEQAHEQAHEGETSAPEESGCGHCAPTENNEEVKRESDK